MLPVTVTLFLFGVSGECQVAKGPPRPQRLMPGDYVRNDYLNGLEKTHSPLKALAFGSPQLVVVKTEEAGLALTTIFNFHDGGSEFLLRQDGSLGVQIDAGFVTANLIFRIIDSRHFVLGFDKFSPQTYTFVGDLAHYAREFLLVGRYVDQHGKPYVFDRDGTAVFPDHKFRYSVGTDQVLNRFDYFQDNTRHEVFGFRRTGDTLEIFRTRGDINQYVDSTPFLSLHK
jgi:hypothetical protein